MLYFTLTTTKLHQIKIETSGSDITDRALECFKGKIHHQIYISEKQQKKGISFKDHAGRREEENEVERVLCTHQGLVERTKLGILYFCYYRAMGHGSF